MTKFRGLLFNVLFYSWTAIIPILALPFVWFDRSNAARCSSFWMRVTYQMEKYILGLDYQVIGRENLPDTPCIIAMKHQSAWETMKLFHLFNNPAIVMKKELLKLPLWGWYARIMEMIPIDRSKGTEALELMESTALQAIQKGRHVVIFPQGTRTAPGEKKSYKQGVMKLYDKLDVPLVPVAINAGLYWPKNRFWKRGGLITVEILPAIPPGLPISEAAPLLQERIETASDRLAQQVTVA